MPRLRRSQCSRPGITRRKAGKGFVYLTPEGKVVDGATRARIAALVIPPAWTDVWICPDERGHIQALGTDAAGRRQYLYHPDWRKSRDRQKFDHMVQFAKALPVMRKATDEHLGLRGFPREKVLAAAVRLLDRGFFRIGSESYADQNQTFGLATITKDHVTIGRGCLLTFDYVAKSGLQRIQSVIDPSVCKVIRALKQREGGGEELLAYKAGSRWVDVKSADINLYIKEISGGDFSAKDFRTWNATVLAAVALSVSTGANTSESALRRAIARAVKEVAEYMGNTPAVCRASYIDPRIFDRYRNGQTVAAALHDLGDVSEIGEPAFQGAVEMAVLDLLVA